MANLSTKYNNHKTQKRTEAKRTEEHFGISGLKQSVETVS
jgi:hypothetical protein